jgi:hypothetical protein
MLNCHFLLYCLVIEAGWGFGYNTDTRPHLLHGQALELSDLFCKLKLHFSFLVLRASIKTFCN